MERVVETLQRAQSLLPWKVADVSVHLPQVLCIKLQREKILSLFQLVVRPLYEVQVVQQVERPRCGASLLHRD